MPRKCKSNPIHIEYVAGGEAEGISSDELVEMINKKTTFDGEMQLRMGIEVEKEHTHDARIAEEIARDHLIEFPNYYSALEEMEAELRLQWGISREWLKRKDRVV